MPSAAGSLLRMATDGQDGVPALPGRAPIISMTWGETPNPYSSPLRCEMRGGSEFLRTQDAHVGFEGDHPEPGKEIALQSREQHIGGGGLEDDLHLYVG